ncbi:MAG: hypothetical protein AAF215_22090 [Cyanobacteria bacterium P01_A01_bin.123]
MKTPASCAQNLLNLPRPDAATALAEYSQDPLTFETRCAREYIVSRHIARRLT